MRRTLILISCLSFLLFTGGLVTEGLADDYPAKSIRLIIPYSAGGGTDVLARTIQKPLSRELGANIVIENIPAGTTKVATLELMKSQPDGYTLLLVAPEAYVGYYYSGTYNFKPWEKLTIIGNTGEEPYGFIEVRADSPYSSWKELVAYAKQNPGKLSVGGPGAGGMMNLIAAETAKAAGIEVKYVPFAGAGPSRNALLGGHTDYRVCQASESVIMIRAGKTKGLAVSSNERLEALPDVPTFQELGIGGNITLTKAFFGPKDMPEDRVQIFSKALEKAVYSPEFVEFGKKIIYKPLYKDSKLTKKEIEEFDKTFGPNLAAFFKK